MQEKYLQEMEHIQILREWLLCDIRPGDKRKRSIWDFELIGDYEKGEANLFRWRFQALRAVGTNQELTRCYFRAKIRRSNDKDQERLLT